MTAPRGSGGAIAPAHVGCAASAAPARARSTPAMELLAEGADRIRDGQQAAGESCDYCGAEALTWRKCKLICGNCAQINKSCADL